MAKGTVAVRFTGDAADLKRSLDGVDGQLRTVGSRFGGFAKTAGLAFGAVAVGAVVVGKQFVDAAVESQKVTAQTEAVLKSMGDGANVTADQVADLSTKLSLQTGIDDELIQSGENLLLTFGNIQNGVGDANQIFDRATEAALDMSVAMGTDMTSASVAIGKALNDPIDGLSKLSRVGIQFTDEQKDMIVTMAEAGDTAGAQAVMLDELERQFGGSAEAQATAGDKLKVAWGNVQEQLGGVLLPIFESVSAWLAEHLPGAIAVATPIIQTIVDKFKDFASKVGDAAEAVRSFIEDRLAELATWWEEKGPGIVEKAQAVADFFNDKLKPALENVGAYITDTLIPALSSIVTWIVENDAALVGFSVFVGVVMVGAFVAYAVAAWNAAAATIAATWPVVAAAVVLAVLAAGLWYAYENWGWFRDGIWKTIFALITVKGWIETVVGWVDDLGQSINDVLGPLGDLLGKIGGGGIPGIPGSGLIPGFDSGGVVPGPRGAPKLIMAHGGETVLPTHKTGGGAMTINLVVDGRVLASFVRDFDRGLA